MRIRLDVVRAWQSDNERPFFYAGPRKGAEVAAWKQAVRADVEVPRVLERYDRTNGLLNGAKFEYPLAVLRLSIQSYRLSRTIVVDKVCSAVLFASRGITVG